MPSASFPATRSAVAARSAPSPPGAPSILRPAVATAVRRLPALAALAAIAAPAVAPVALAQQGVRARNVVAAAPVRRPIELEDYYRLRSAGSPALSPDGSRVAFVVTSVLEDENRRHSEVWIADADGAGDATRLTSPSFSSSGPAWTPDGRLLHFSSRRPGPDGQPAAGPWFLRMDGGVGEAFQVDGLDGSPEFSPDGRWIAFVRPAPPAGSPPGASYDSDFERRTAERFDGRDYDWMNYRFDRRGYLPDPRDPWATPPREVFVLPAAGGEARQLTGLGVNASGLAWSPDGTRIAFTADEHQRDERSYERADLWVVTLAGSGSGPGGAGAAAGLGAAAGEGAASPTAAAGLGAVTRLTDDEYNYSAPAWSPDGAEIAVRGNEGLDVIIREARDRGASSELFVFDARTGERVRNVTEEWDLIPSAPVWSPDGRHIYFSGGIRGNSHLFRVPAPGGAVEQVTEGDRRLGSFSFSADFASMAFTATDPVRPADVWVAAAAGGGERRISRANDELLGRLDLASPDRLLFQSEDGTEIEGWMLPALDYPSGVLDHPAGERGNAAAAGPGRAGGSGAGGSTAGFPMILVMHGGPHGAYGNDFSFDRQLLAAQGYMVLYTNPRASTGYGEDFRWGTWGGWGFRDYEDVMAGVDHALDSYDIDPARMGVTGYSYGGYLTNWVITQTNRFAAAVAGASISNWVSDYGVADIPRTKESEFYGPPWEERGLANLMRSSPIVHAAGVTTPTMFVHGETDHRVPIEEAEQMYVALHKQGVPARFVRYPDSYHGGWTPWRTVHRTWVQLEWWDQWLSRRPAS